MLYTRIVEQLNRLTLPQDLNASVGEVEHHLGIADSEIRAKNVGNPRGTGSTVVVLGIVGRQYFCLWAGDSRLYLMRGQGLVRLTTDHSRLQALIDGGLLSENDAKDHPEAHVITQAIGVGFRETPSICAGETIEGDVFLLCSDGLVRHVSDPEIASILRSSEPEGAARALIKETLNRGGTDNISVIVIEVSNR